MFKNINLNVCFYQLITCSYGSSGFNSISSFRKSSRLFKSSCRMYFLKILYARLFMRSLFEELVRRAYFLKLFSRKFVRQQMLVH